MSSLELHPDQPAVDVTSLGHRLRVARVQAGLQQRDVAERLKVSRVTVSNWERDVSVPSEENLEKLATLLRTSARLLRYGEIGGQWDPEPDVRGQGEDEADGQELAAFVGDMDRVIRTLSALPQGPLGARLKLEFLGLVEAAAAEAGQRLPAKYWEIRQKVHEGEL